MFCALKLIFGWHTFSWIQSDIKYNVFYFNNILNVASIWYTFVFSFVKYISIIFNQPKRFCYKYKARNHVWYVFYKTEPQRFFLQQYTVQARITYMLPISVGRSFLYIRYPLYDIVLCLLRYRKISAARRRTYPHAYWMTW